MPQPTNMKRNTIHNTSTPGDVLAMLNKEARIIKRLNRKDAQVRRTRTQQVVQSLVESTPESRIAAAKARAGVVHAQIDQIVAEADVDTDQTQPVEDVSSVRIDDFDTLFVMRERLPERLRERLKTIYAKMHWKKRDGTDGYFNIALHKNHIPIDKALTILAHLEAFHDGTGRLVTPSVDAVLECELYTRIKRGKFEYGRRCQDAEHCELCNYINISDGLKVLHEAYDRTAFRRGGNWFAITVAPRTDATHAMAVGRALTAEDWDRKYDGSFVHKESLCGRVFRYPDTTEDQDGEWHIESCIRSFLGAVQYIFGKLIKNCWLDGIRARVENSVEFLPYASHQHWHAVGSATCEHAPQKIADFIKSEVDAILAETCPGMYADVMVATLPSPEDLRRWIKYTNKTINLVVAVGSVYNRFHDLHQDAQLYRKFITELRLHPERSRQVFGMIRCPILHDERGHHTYMLRKRYVRGCHKFGAGSILSEPKRHRLWRKQHAQKTAARRAAARMEDDD